MNHRIFERKLRSLDTQGARLSECRLKFYTLWCGVKARVGASLSDLIISGVASDPSFQVPEPGTRFALVFGRLNLLLSFREHCLLRIRLLFGSLVISSMKITNFYILTSDQARLPAEFKHINKRRKRN